MLYCKLEPCTENHHTNENNVRMRLERVQTVYDLLREGQYFVHNNLLQERKVAALAALEVALVTDRVVPTMSPQYLMFRFRPMGVTRIDYGYTPPQEGTLDITIPTSHLLTWKGLETAVLAICPEDFADQIKFYFALVCPPIEPQKNFTLRLDLTV
jgi:hypothetical protein